MGEREREAQPVDPSGFGYQFAYLFCKIKRLYPKNISGGTA
jgi:hypothetical protein